MTLPAQDAAKSAGWIVLPAGEYKALRSRAYPAAAGPDLSAPVDATLTRVDYNLKIDGELASGQAALTVDVLKDGWVEVPIPSGLLVREARLDNKLVSLVDDAGSGSHHRAALLQKRGRSVLSLDVALPVSVASGEERLELPAGASGVTRAAITLTRQDMDIKVSGGFLAERAESSGESKWLAYGKGSEPLAFTWKRKTGDHKVELPLRMRGALTQLCGLGEDSTSLYAEVNLEILQGAAPEAHIQLPDSVAVNQVLGATVGEWQARNGELVVRFLEPAEHTVRFIITGDTRLPREGAVNVPILALLDAERDSGGIAVEVLGSGELKDTKAQGLEAAEATELGSTIAARQSPSLAAFRFRLGVAPPARSLTVQVARYAQTAVLTANIEEARYRIQTTREGNALVEARYAIRNNQRNFVKIAVPQGSAVWSATLGGRPVHPGKSPDGALLFPLNKARAGEDATPFAIELLYQAPGAPWDEKGRAGMALPVVDLPISRTGVLFYSPAEYKLTVDPGAFRPEEFRAPTSPALVRNAAAETPTGSPNNNSQTRQPDLLAQLNSDAAEAATQALVDRYSARANARKPASNAWAGTEFPAVGTSVFLVSELTGENQAVRIDWSYQREGKRGVR